MSNSFPRLLTLARREKGVSQKQASQELGISQALLSHYENGIRECGLDFLVRAAGYYNVSCDYLLGRSPDRSGLQIAVEDIPEPDSAGKENVLRGSSSGVLPLLNKKLIFNSLNIIFDLLARVDNNGLTGEISAYLMLAAYRVFRVIHSVNPKNPAAMFTVESSLYRGYVGAAMDVAQANAQALAAGEDVGRLKGVKDRKSLTVTTENISENYPLFASSLLNLISTGETRVNNMRRDKNE